MNDKKKTPRVRKDEWLGKPVDQWTEQDEADYADYLNNRRPIRFFSARTQPKRISTPFWIIS
jgi:hypothetical protein